MEELKQLLIEQNKLLCEQNMILKTASKNMLYELIAIKLHTDPLYKMTLFDAKKYENLKAMNQKLFERTEISKL
ncbi:MAG: hypothetical protein LBV80_11575 [Deltaproteobacteria bacterium]|jgi:hypothetical protein|nr:hypothetical protein [Deltaproteobacteria bacterium]